MDARFHAPLFVRRGAFVAVIGFASCLGGCPAATSTAAAPSLEASRIIKVNGIATLEVNPDVVDLTLTLTVPGKLPRDAVSGLDAQREALLAALSGSGLPDSALRLSHVNVSPVYESHPERRIARYEASVTLVATLSDFTQIDDLMEVAATHGVSRMFTRFRSTRMPEMKVKVRDMALAAARAKAGQVATVMEVELGDVLAVEELARDTPVFGGLANSFEAAEPGEAPVQPGAKAMTLTVVVTYAHAAS